MLALIAAFGCTGPREDSSVDTGTFEPVPWSSQRAPLDETSLGGRAWKRGIIHLHSPFSHDACDGRGLPGGVPDESCLQDLRDGLCLTAMDFAMITDHPAYAADQEWEDLLLSRDGDEIVDDLANRVACADGRSVLTMPGIEDELMPIALDRPAADTASERDRLYNASDAEAFAADIAAGAAVMQAHTEQPTLDTLLERQGNGLAGVELFNLHAMLDPDIREDYLGLDAFGYADAISPFVTGDTDAQPDLLFLAFFEEQGASLEKLDALAAVAPISATAGTDAHQNVFPNLLGDGERVDSYRRMMAWFSNIVLADGDTPADYQSAIEAGRLFVAFEILGTPTGFSVSYEDLEMGGTAPTGGTLTVTCPMLAADTPKDGDPPEITAIVLKDGETWQTGCGSWPVTDAGVYRVRVDIEPRHLAGFLDDQADALIHPYPWLYSNPLRIGL